MNTEAIVKQICDVIRDFLKQGEYVFMAAVVLCICVTQISSCSTESSKHYYEWRIQRDKTYSEDNKVFWNRNKSVGPEAPVGENNEARTN